MMSFKKGRGRRFFVALAFVIGLSSFVCNVEDVRADTVTVDGQTFTYNMTRSYVIVTGANTNTDPKVSVDGGYNKGLTSFTNGWRDIDITITFPDGNFTMSGPGTTCSETLGCTYTLDGGSNSYADVPSTPGTYTVTFLFRVKRRISNVQTDTFTQTRTITYTVTGPAPTATISATGPVAFESGNLWQKTVSFFTGRDHVARASGSNPSILVGQNARISWSSTGADSCSISNGIGSVTPNTSGNQRLVGLPQGSHTYTITCRKSGLADVADSVTVIVANPTTTYTITASAGAGGSISPSGTVSNIAAGSNRSFTISPNTGYAVNNVLVDGGSVGAVTSYTFSNITADHTISATFNAVAGPRCLTPMSNNATVYAGDNTGLSTDTPYTYSATNTTPKCQYFCNSGFSWNGSECASDTVYICTGTRPANTRMWPGDTSNLTSNVSYRWSATDTSRDCEYQCNAGSVWDAGTQTCNGPSVSLSINPSSVPWGNTSTITWTPSSDVTSCWASEGGAPWTNTWVSPTGGSMTISTAGRYTIECFSATGFTGPERAFLTADLRRANLNVGTCQIASGASTCPAPVSWSSLGLSGGASIRQDGVQFSTALSMSGAANLTRPITHTAAGGNTFTFVHIGDTLDTAVAGATCSGTLVWNGSICTVATPAPVTTFTGTYGAQSSLTTLNLPAGGGNVTLNWSVTNAVGGSCTGYSTTNLPGWSSTGGKAVSGSSTVSVNATTRFDLDCWNNVGTAAQRKSVQVNVAAAPAAPSATLTVGTCQIADNASTCPAPISWSSADLTGPASIRQDGVEFDTRPIVLPAVNLTRPITHTVVGNTFTFVHNNTPPALDTVTAGATCSPTAFWNGTICATACSPSITCNNHAAEIANTCAGTDYTFTDDCTVEQNCPGTRSCDYNWKEVAP